MTFVFLMRKYGQNSREIIEGVHDFFFMIFLDSLEVFCNFFGGSYTYLVCFVLDRLMRHEKQLLIKYVLDLEILIKMLQREGEST